MLKNDFIPVAIDQWYTRRQQDTEGDFYRKIAGQGPRSDFNKTTQGLYIADPAGNLISYNNNRGPERIRKRMEEALAKYTPPRCKPIEEKKIDSEFDPQLPAGAVVVRCGAKITEGYEQTEDQWRAIFQRSIARDNLWILEKEIESIAKGEFPDSLARRIARFHLVDNTRGQPPSWASTEIRTLNISISGQKLTGQVYLETNDKSRGFVSKLKGEVIIKEGKLTKFDLIAEGEFWGAGEFTFDPPKGRFPLVVAFRLPDDPDKADAIPPAGSRGWLDGYLDPNR